MVLQVDTEFFHFPGRAFGNRRQVVTVAVEPISHLGHLLGGLVGADGDFAAARLQGFADLIEFGGGVVGRRGQFGGLPVQGVGKRLHVRRRRIVGAGQFLAAAVEEPADIVETVAGPVQPLIQRLDMTLQRRRDAFQVGRRMGRRAGGGIHVFAHRLADLADVRHRGFRRLVQFPRSGL